jgi:cell division protein FtsA
MRKRTNKNLIAALDIGTSKVSCLVAEVTESGMDIIALGTSPSHGLKRGVVINIDATVQAIQQAVTKAERMIDSPIRQVHTGIAGNHIRSLNSHGIVAITHQEVTQSDVDRVIEAAQAVAIPADQQMLHMLPQAFIIDHQEGIREPIGMSGVRLEAKVHLVTGAVSAVQNIIKCVQRVGLSVADIVLEQLASAQAVLTEDEKELGVCLLDIGGGTTDIAVFTEGAIRHTAVIPIAGDQVTHDIAIALRTPTHSAETIKLQYACLQSDPSDAEVLVEVPSVGDRPGRSVLRQALTEVVGARYEELFHLVKAELYRSGYLDHIAAGLVLTGGASNVIGCVELAEQLFKEKELPVRRGYPHYQGNMTVSLNNGIHATGIGLLMHGCQRQHMPAPAVPLFRSVLSRMKAWLRDNF